MNACVLDRGEVIESDHAGIRVEIEWKVGIRPRKKKRRIKR